jgi:phenylacetate-CoA ligase
MSFVGDAVQGWVLSNPRRGGWLSQKVPERISENMGRKKVLRIFREASETVPAYRDLLQAHGIDAKSVRDWEGFQTLPLLDKNSYLIPHQDHPEHLCVGGRLDACYAITRSSGTTGHPIFWPWIERQDASTVRGMETMWVNFWDVDKVSTLIIICFDLGMWGAGEMGAQVGRVIAKKYGHISVATPGSNIDETVDVIRHLAHNYEQILVLGYPPFLRQLVGSGGEAGIAWDGLKVSFLPGGEGYSEHWRDSMLERLGKQGSLNTILGAFGSSEGQVIGPETPLSVVVRRLANDDVDLRRDLYGTEANCDALVQYTPAGVFVEMVDGEIVITNGGAVPVVRYNSHDMGGSTPFERVMEVLEAHGYGPPYLRDAGVAQHHVWQMPFLYAFGRKDCVIVDGANIYAEGVAPALLLPGMEEIHNWKLTVQERDDGRLQFVILVETLDGVSPTADAAKARTDGYQQAFLGQLLEVNPDFRSAYRNNPECLTPVIRLYARGTGPFEGEGSKIKQLHIYRGTL